MRPDDLARTPASSARARRAAPCARASRTALRAAQQRDEALAHAALALRIRQARASAIRPARARSANAGRATSCAGPHREQREHLVGVAAASARHRARPGSRGAARSRRRAAPAPASPSSCSSKRCSSALADAQHHARRCGRSPASSARRRGCRASSTWPRRAASDLLVVEPQAFLAPARDQVQAEAQARPARGVRARARRIRRRRAGRAPPALRRSRTPTMRSAIQRSVCRSRRPPGPSLRFGSRLSAVSSKRAWRARCSSRLAAKNSRGGQTLLGDDRRLQRVRAPRRRPTSGRASSSAVSTVMSSRAACGALRGRAHGVADRQAGVPEQREEARQRSACVALRRGFGQHQQVDVGVREQFAAAVAADREQRQRRVAGDAAAPGHRAPCASTARGARRSRRSSRLAGREVETLRQSRRSPQRGHGASSAPVRVVGRAARPRASSDPASAPAAVTGRCRRPARGSGSRRRRR